jgi:hypothetical protein
VRDGAGVVQVGEVLDFAGVSGELFLGQPVLAA